MLFLRVPIINIKNGVKYEITHDCGFRYCKHSETVHIGLSIQDTAICERKENALMIV